MDNVEIAYNAEKSWPTAVVTSGECYGGCGSGHIIVEAYKVLKAIYEERGFRTRDIPQLILENNLFGLDIDDRAGQLAGFALMMLAREDDRRIFSRNIRLNVLSLQESSNVNLPSLWRSLNLTGEWQSGTSQGLFEEDQQDLSAFAADNRYRLLQRTLERFKQAKTFGSLIDVPHDDYEELKELFVTLCELDSSGDSMQKAAASQLLPYIHQAVLLAQKYDAVIANPPYMGSKGMNAALKEFAKKEYPNSKSDLFAIFIERGFGWLKNAGFNSMVTMQSWMFLSSYEQMRELVLSRRTIENMVHMGNGVMKIAFGTNATVFRNLHLGGYQGCFSFTDNDGINDEGVPFEFPVKNERLKVAASDDFKKIPGSPIAYWLNREFLDCFDNRSFNEFLTLKQGLATGDNERFLRYWWEVDYTNIEFGANDLETSSKNSKSWFPYSKGGEARKWYGCNELVVFFPDNGNVIRNFKDDNGNERSRFRAPNYYFKPAITWSLTSSSTQGFCARIRESGYVFDINGMSAFGDDLDFYVGLMNSNFSSDVLKVINPTMAFQIGDVGKLPVPDNIDSEKISENAKRCVEISKRDWDSYETAWGYRSFFAGNYDGNKTLRNFCSESLINWINLTDELCNAQNAINYEVDTSLGLDVTREYEASKIQLSRVSDVDPSIGFDPIQSGYEILSYSLGCMSGRYSLERKGIVYAHSGNIGFAELVSEGAYKTFPADDDGIIPLTDQEWFPDDATNRFREFVKVVWGEEYLQENLDFVAESLCLHAIKPKKSESSMDTIRRYLSTQFYKDHLKTYKKRPIYWLFSSGKQKAFECLLYLHRYNEGTLARMRTEYVIPLTAKMTAYAQKLEKDKEASGSAAEVKRLEKEIAQLHKQQAELSEFDEKLRHYADQRIGLDLDDGVKVNYGKFGDLLAEVKAITGEAPEE